MDTDVKEEINQILDKDIKRGVDLGNRLWGNQEKKSQRSYSLFRTPGRNKITYFFVAVIFLLNLALTLPLLTQDLSNYYSSFVLTSLVNSIVNLHILDKAQVFMLLAFIPIAFAPISVYFFVRNNVWGDEFAAFLATLFFVLPNPFLGKELTVVNSILHSDGAHSFVFPLIPFFLLYFQDYLATGMFKFAAITSIGGALIAIISPFGFFNFIIMLLILGVSDGFLRDLRAKLVRLFSVILLSLGLCLFWYYPTLIQNILSLNYIQITMQRTISNIPIFLPLVPILGIILFLVLDRRAKWQSFFIGISFFLVYLVLFFISKATNVPGIFTPYRYALELSFSASFLLSLTIIYLLDLLFKSILHKVKRGLKTILFGVVFLILSSSLLILGVVIAPQRSNFKQPTILQNKNAGIGTIKRNFNLNNLSFDIASSISIATLLLILLLSFKKGSNIKT